MYTIIDELLENAEKLNIDISTIPTNETEKMVEEIHLKYIDENPDTSFLWEDMSASEYITDADGWQYIGDFVDTAPCFMMFYEFNKWNIVKVNSGKQLTTLLGESSAFEFYVFDESLSYFICFSHHDQLIGCGKAKELIKNLK